MNAAAEIRSKSRAETVQKIVTPRGIEVWLVEDYAVPLVAVDFAFKGGSTQDPAGLSGTATVLAGLLDEGAGTLDADAFHRALDDKAIELSFHTGQDNFHGEMKTLSRNIDAAFDMLRLAVNEPRFDTDAIERVRSQLIAGLRHEANDPNAVSGKAWREAAFPHHPYGLPTGGSLESVPLIGREHIAALRQRLFALSNLKVAVVGAIDADRLAKLIDRVFGALPAAPSLTAIPDIAPQGAGTRKVIEIDVPQSTLRFSLPGIARHDADFITGAVVNHILGGGVFSARLFKEVREKRGLAYSVWTQLHANDHTALFSGGTSTKNERAAESLQVIEEEINKIAETGPTAEELAKAQKYMIGSYALRFDTSTKIAANLVSLQTDGYPVDYLDRRNGLIAAVTLDDARRVAKRLFDHERLLVAVAGKPSGL
ncbi:MAG TPA: pitrilysin family protein [Beijerinckiaceae bacterium]|jgi:zinc protease|nr:pitrilysin family protein [Beijerinckiaceae bacterium]